MNLAENKISIERVNQLIFYDPGNGAFFWRVQRGYTASPGASAGCVAQHRYLQITIERTKIMAHRLAWAIMTGNWPSAQIDHINCNGLDNRFSNLREATSEQNAWNRRLSGRNKSGFKGVSWNKNETKWVASIRFQGRKTHLGYFDAPDAAHAAYNAAAQKFFQQFAWSEGNQS